MAIDGVFLHHLITELTPFVKDAKVNKIIQPDYHIFIMNIRKNGENRDLLLSYDLNNARIHLTNEKYDNPTTPYGFCMLLRKYLERSIITGFEQIENDRLVKLTFKTSNELGDDTVYHLFLEIMGRNANLILTNDSYIIIDAVRHFVPSLDNEKARIILPKATYVLPSDNGQINPYKVTTFSSLDTLQGVSKALIKEINLLGNVNKIITRETLPVVYEADGENIKSSFFYCFKLDSLTSSFKTYPSLSKMLDYYYKKETNNNTSFRLDLQKQVSREINRLKQKKANLLDDLENAKTHLKDKDIALTIQCYLYQIKKGDKTYQALNPWTNEEMTIKLDPLLSPLDNMKKYFHSAKKSENALKHLDLWLLKTNKDIAYLEDIYEEIYFADHNSIEEIKNELLKEHFLIKRKNAKLKRKTTTKIVLTNYHINNNIILVGKCNTQNDYLINKVANPNDYWFHVKGAPSAHVVLKCDELNERLIRTAAQIAALNSHFKTSSSVPIDYTKIRFLKKIPKEKGYHVTYTNQATIYIDPDPEELNRLLKEKE